MENGMDIFDVLTLLGGLSLFLFGMNVMGHALERRAGGKLRGLLARLTTGRVAGLLTGLGITAAIQSSTATTVMVVGFVNSGVMTLKQAVNVIMGANIGTTVTAWILSLAGISSSNMFVKLLKPASFTPILAVIGIILYMFIKNDKKKDTGLILLGFATLMTGMETMSGAVSPLRSVPEFQNLFIAFKNPILGVAAGAVLTAIIQSSSASVGILQALAVTGQVSYGAAVPIIMGQNIGTCVTAMISSVGANRNAKRAALVHLSFNVIGTALWLTVFWLVEILLRPAILDEAATLLGIAVTHTVFNVLCTLVMLPLAGFLEMLVMRIVPENAGAELPTELDERLLATPTIALETCAGVARDLGLTAVGVMRAGMHALTDGADVEMIASIRQDEEKTDHYEDILGTYLVKLSALETGEETREAAKLLKAIGDFERIADYGLNLLKAAEEMAEKNVKFTESARRELDIITSAVDEVMGLTVDAFAINDISAAARVEPLAEVINKLREQLRANHIRRMQRGQCTIDAGFIWADALNCLGRTADHCSNIAGSITDMNLHELLRDFREKSPEYRELYREYADKYCTENQ
jgi:phosphate:Na+ symporter